MTANPTHFKGSHLRVEAGSGITSGTGTIYKSAVYRFGGIIKTEIFVDLTGLNHGGSAGDIIGVNGAANCHLGQINFSECGTIMGGRISCVEAPATGSADIDVYAADESTGTEDAAVSGLTETQLVNAGAHSATTSDGFTALPTDGQYLYLVGQGASGATYTAGKLLIELWGYDAIDGATP